MIPVSVALVSALVVAPLVVFLASLLQPAPAALATALTVVALARVLKLTEWREKLRLDLALAALAVGALLTLLSGVGHVVWQTDDWTVRDAMLIDLERYAWPVSYALGDRTGVLRAPLGMYMVPGFVGRLLGAGAGEAALFVQNALLFAACLYAFATTAPKGRAQWIVIGLFVVFSGLDSLAWAKRIVDGTPGNLLLPHLDPWPGGLQFTSHMSQLFWVPHHALGGWACVAAFQAWRVGRAPALLMAPVWAASVFWSPLAAAGMIPFLIFAFVCDLLDGKLRAADFATALAAGLGAAPAAAFLTLDAQTIEKGFLDFTSPTTLQSYGANFLLKAAPWLALAWEATRGKDRRTIAEFLLIFLALLAIPTYRLGFANDFAMRVSIPALALLALRAAPAIAVRADAPLRRKATAGIIVALAAITPGVEIWRNVTEVAQPMSACNLLEAMSEGPAKKAPKNYYIADAASFAAMKDLFRAPEAAPLQRRIEACWPGRTFVYADD